MKIYLTLLTCIPLLIFAQTDSPDNPSEIPVESDSHSYEEVDIIPEEADERETQIFTMVESMPEFPGGPAAMFKFIVEELVYPKAAIDAGIEGKVYVQFTVIKSGEIDNVKVLRGIGGGCDEEAVRVLKTMPKWTPGMQRGKPVSVMYTLPFSFQIPTEEPVENQKE